MGCDRGALRRLVLAAALAVAALPAAAEQEPYGQTVQGWRFTQDVVRGVVWCRAFSPGPTAGVIVQRRGDGQFYLSVPVRNVRAGQHEEASFEVGRNAEPMTVRADGNRLYLPVDDTQVAQVAGAGRFRWAVNGRRQVGEVVVGPGFGAAIGRLRQCTRANGGR